jgi:Tfp pilus assembly protein PilO
MKILTEARKVHIGLWLEAHKKAIVIAMLITVFINLLIMVFSVLTLRTKPHTGGINKLKQAKEKVHEATKIKYDNAVNVNNLYQKANAIMQKDSLTKNDYEALKSIDSTMQSLIKVR